MPRRETLNNANTAKRMTETFGHSNIIATLSQALTYNKISTVSPLAGASIYGFPWNEPREARLFFIPIRL